MLGRIPTRLNMGLYWESLWDSAQHHLSIRYFVTSRTNTAYPHISPEALRLTRAVSQRLKPSRDHQVGWLSQGPERGSLVRLNIRVYLQPGFEEFSGEIWVSRGEMLVPDAELPCDMIVTGALRSVLNATTSIPCCPSKKWCRGAKIHALIGPCSYLYFKPCEWCEPS
jgi:hypothetical protein